MEYALLADWTEPESGIEPSRSAPVQLSTANAQNDLLEPYAALHLPGWRIACQHSFGGYSPPFVQHQLEPCLSLPQHPAAQKQTK
jgi:hypothetical protein